MTSSTRERRGKSRRRQARLEAQWDPEQNSWQKKAKCGICRRAFVVNNYPDRKIRVNQHKVAGVIVCAWCADRDAKFIVQLMKIAERIGGLGCQRPDLAGEQDSCKCLPCTAERTLKRHEALPARR